VVWIVHGPYLAAQPARKTPGRPDGLGDGLTMDWARYHRSHPVTCRLPPAVPISSYHPPPTALRGRGVWWITRPGVEPRRGGYPQGTSLSKRFRPAYGRSSVPPAVFRRLHRRILPAVG
jgi:hypothetical protein